MPTKTKTSTINRRTEELQFDNIASTGEVKPAPKAKGKYRDQIRAKRMSMNAEEILDACTPELDLHNLGAPGWVEDSYGNVANLAGGAWWRRFAQGAAHFEEVIDFSGKMFRGGENGNPNLSTDGGYSAKRKYGERNLEVAQSEPTLFVAYDADHLIEHIHNVSRHQEPSEGSWSGSNMRQWLKDRFTPDDAAAQAADAVFDEIREALDLGSLSRTLTRDVVGGSASVGDFLKGNPMSMRRRKSKFNKQGPVRFFIDLSTSWTWSASDVRTRALISLALAAAVQQVRPVELWGCVTGSCSTRSGTNDVKSGRPKDKTFRLEHMSVVLAGRLSLAPFDLTSACRLMASPWFPRGLGYRFITSLVGNAEFNDSREMDSYFSDSIPFCNRTLRDAVGATADDICIGSDYSDKMKATMLENPAEFARKELVAWLTRSGETEALEALKDPIEKKR